MGLLDMFGGDQAATPQASGGGMFDAYSGQNQTNLQMAMLADMVGNFAGKDVGAMKSIMPLVENARQLRLQEEEGVAFNNMVAGMSPEMQAIAKHATPKLRSLITQGEIARINAKPAAQWGDPYEGPFGNLLRKNKNSGKVERVSGPQAKAAQTTFNNNTGGNLMEKMGYDEMTKVNLLQSTQSEGASAKLATHERMLRILQAKDEADNYVTDVGAVAKATLPWRNAYNSVVETFGGEEGLSKIGLSDTTLHQVLDSDNKDLALLAAALMKGNLSEKELDFSVDLFARLGNTREANIILTKLGMMKEQAAIARNKHMTEWELNLDPTKFSKGGQPSAYKLNLLRKRELQAFNTRTRKENGYRLEAMWMESGEIASMSAPALDFMWRSKGGADAHQ